MLGLEFPWYFGVITSLFGLFALGYFLGRLAPREFFWEFPVGTALFALLFMGLTSQGAGALAFLAKGVLVPVLAGAVGYLGVTTARRGQGLNGTPSCP